MDDMLLKIIEADSAQRERIKTAEKSKCSMDESINKYISDLKKQYSEHAEKRIATLKKAQALYAEETVDKYFAENQKIIDNLNKMFEENCEKWAAELFARIIKNDNLV